MLDKHIGRYHCQTRSKKETKFLHIEEWIRDLNKDNTVVFGTSVFL